MIQMGNTAGLVVLIILFFLCYQWPRRSWACRSTRWIWDRTAESLWRPGRLSWWCPGWWRYNETGRAKFEVFLSPWVRLESVCVSCEWSVPARPADIFWGVSSAHIDLQPAQDGLGAPAGPAGDPLLQEQKRRRRSGFMWNYVRLLDGGPHLCE